MSGTNGNGPTQTTPNGAAAPQPVTQEQPKGSSSTAIVHWEPQNATEAWMLAKYYAQSCLIPDTLKDVADVFVTIAAGRDFGWSPMQSMRGIYVVNGKPSLSADAMVGIAKKSGLCEYFRLIESTATKATFETKRKGDADPTRMSFTIEEARLAGLTEKKDSLYLKYPARMLRNRCKSFLCKEVYEELFFGVYEESEAEEIVVNHPPQPRIPSTVAPTDVDVTPVAPKAQETAAPAASAEQQPAAAPAGDRSGDDQRMFDHVAAADSLEAFKAALDGIGAQPKDKQVELRLALIRQIDLHLGKQGNQPSADLGKLLFRVVAGLPEDQRDLGQKVYNRHKWLRNGG